jgi:hypothetical protein
MKKLCIVFGFILIFTFPLFAQEVEDVAVSEEETVPIEEADEGVVTGEVVSLDVNAGLISVKAEDGTEKTFSVVEGETILWKGIEDIALTNVNKGDKAEVGYYTDEAGKLIASWVDVLVEEVAPATGEEVAPAASEEVAPIEEGTKDILEE